MTINFKVIGLTRLGIKPESTDPEADALNARSYYNIAISTGGLGLDTGPGKSDTDRCDVSSELRRSGVMQRSWTSPLLHATA